MKLVRVTVSSPLPNLPQMGISGVAACRKPTLPPELLLKRAPQRSARVLLGWHARDC